MNINIIYENSEFTITECKPNKGNKILVIIFVSAGGAAFGGKDINEFFNTFKSSIHFESFDICWVKDNKIVWYNFTTTECVDNLIKISHNYEYVYTMGESMGASASLYFGHLIKANRILALGPQFCVADPFIRFNVQLNLPNINSYIKTNIYKFEDIMNKSLLLFGAESWQDYIHALLFKDCGYVVKYILGSNHSIASYLKENNKLINLIDIFLMSNETDFIKATNISFKNLMIDKPDLNRINFGR